MKVFRKIPAGLVAAAVTLAPPAVYGTTVSQLTSASQLSPNDINLGIVSAAQPVGTVSVGNSMSFVTGDKVTFSRNSGQFEVDQAGTTYGDTAFSNGTNLVGAGGFQGSGDGGPISVTFATPVIQFGVNIEDFNFGPYSIGFLAYDTSGQLIDSSYDPVTGIGVPGIFSASGVTPGTAASSQLSFEGLTATGGSISKVVFFDGGISNDLMFGNLAFAPVGTALQAPPAVTPEPSSIALLGTGILSLAAFTRRAKGFLRNSSAR